MCKPYDLALGRTTAGFPLPPWAAPSTGTVRVAVVFVDFPDVEAAHTTRRVADESLAFTEAYLETSSYGRLDIEFVPLHRWLRAEHNHDHYLSAAATGGLEIGRLINEEAVRLADPHFDFTGHDVLLVFTPSSRFDSANAGGTVRTQEGTLTTSRIGAALSVEPRGNPLWWAYTIAHELAHNLGLLDMYPYDASRHELPTDKRWVGSRFGLMGLQVIYPSTRGEGGSAREMLAWSRWQLGWLNPPQIHCVTEPDTTVILNPIALDPGDAIAMAAIPISQSEVIVIESRRKLGYEVGFNASLPIEGVLVYTVNAALRTGDLPVRVAGDNGNGQIDRYPILTVGESVTINGYTITVDADNGATHTVTITKTQNH